MKIKNILAASAIALVSVSSANAVLTYTAGDVLLGFRTSTKDLVIDLGSYTNFTPSNTNVLVAHLASDLVALDASWTTNTALSWGAIGYANPGASNGLIFVSKGETTPGTPVTGWTQTTKSNTTAIYNNISSYTNTGFTSQTSNTTVANGLITTPSSTTSQDWNNYVTGSITGYSGISFGKFSSTIEANATGGSVITSTALDLFKMTANGSGAAPLQGTFTLTSGGDVYFNAVPEPSTYAMIGFGGLGLLGMLRRRSIKA